MEQRWNVVITQGVSDWPISLPDETYQRVIAALVLLKREGPALGRPLVDSLKGSSLANMKELRVGSRRIILAFDMQRTAVLLMAGDKRGQWSHWYREAIPEAEKRFVAWMEQEEDQR